MRGQYAQPPERNLTIVPGVNTDGKNGANEPTSQRLAIGATVSARQGTGTLVGGELVLSDTHAHTAVHPVLLPKLLWRACPVFQYLKMCWRE